MGCGSSSPAVSKQETGKAPSHRPAVAQGKPTSTSASEARRRASVDSQEASYEDDEFDQRKVSQGGKHDTTSTAQSPSASEDKDVHSNAPSQLSSRRSLTGTSGSLGSKVERSWLVPSGWSTGKSVVVRPDARTAHICSLASSIVKAPVVLIITQEAGRSYVTSSKALESLGQRKWLSGFVEWLSLQTLNADLIIKDTTADQRLAGCDWVSGQPFLQFVMATEFQKASDSSTRLGVLVAIDTQPHKDALANPMLANLANMVARELEVPVQEQPFPTEVYTNGVVVGPKFRRIVDKYVWVVFVVDTTRERWPVLHVNHAFHGMSGIPPGCVEGLCFWDFVLPLHSKEEEPWKAYEADIKECANFQLQPVTMQLSSNRDSKNSLSNKQIYRVEMRAYSEATATTYELEQPEVPGQYIACFQPNARFSLDINSTAPAIPEDLPFPGLEMGPVIGKGSFGYVCKGALGNVIVAVKIIEADAIAKVSSEGLPMEVVLSKNLRHPHIVRMLDYATRLRKAKHTSGHASTRQSAVGSASSLTSTSSGHALRFQPGGSSEATPLGSGNEPHKGPDLSEGTLEAWLLIEFCDRGSLQDGMDTDIFGAKSGSPNLPALLTTAYEVAAAMKYLHTHNILHGDLTSGNVLLSSQRVLSDDLRGFCAKVADFGLSRETLTSKVETNSFGTVTHMPPELLNDGILSKCADVYAFGVLLVEMYIGERCFAGMRQPQIIHSIAVLNKHPELPASAPAYLRELANSCMQEAAKERPTFAMIMDTLRPHVSSA